MLVQYLGLLHEQILSGQEFGAVSFALRASGCSDLSSACMVGLGFGFGFLGECFCCCFLGFFSRAMFSNDPAPSCWRQPGMVPSWASWCRILPPFPFSSNSWIFPWGVIGMCKMSGFPSANPEVALLDQPFLYLLLTQDLCSCWAAFFNVPLNCFSRIIRVLCFQLVPSVISTNSWITVKH